MEVTRSNFKAALPEMEAAIRDSIFLAIDGEFTGLSADRGNSPLDLPSERVARARDTAERFLLVQFGLATFHYDQQKDQFTHRAFNIYVWPRPCNRGAPDPRFLCQTSSIDFLTNQGFDFNKLFREGVSYLLPQEVARMRAGLEERQAVRRRSAAEQGSSLPVAVPEEQEEWLAAVLAQVEAFLASTEEKLELGRCNSFQRRLVYQSAQARWPEAASLSAVTNSKGDRVIQVVRADAAGQARLALAKEQKELEELEEALGFSRVVQAITESGKVVVGHNMLLDVAFTLSQFVAPLPTDYQEFKAMASSALPKLVDTKLMANSAPFKAEIFNSSLEELLRTASLPPYSMPEVEGVPGAGYPAGEEGARYHEAGYDAYVTGKCFLSLLQSLGRHAGGGGAARVLPSSPLLQPFLNKLFLMRIPDTPYLDLAGPDPPIAREHVFHLTFPKEWKTADLINLFQERFGGVQVTWIDDTSAYVALREREQAGQVVATLGGSAEFTIQPWAAHRALKDRQATLVAPDPALAPAVHAPEPEQRKRGAPPQGGEVKRLKSVDGAESNGKEKVKVKEKAKTFAEPDWDS